MRQAVAFKNYDFMLSMDDFMGAAGNGGRKRSEMNLVEIYQQVKESDNRSAFRMVEP